MREIRGKMKNNVLIIGSGGRESAIERYLKLSNRVGIVYCAPGNAGSENPVDIDINDFEALSDFAVLKDVKLTVIGPEIPLSKGIVDHFNKKGLKIFGPTQKASMIESSKSFARKLMRKYGIPQPEFKIFNETKQAFEYIRNSINNSMVIKASNLAAGKGAFVCENKEDALRAVYEIESRIGGEILIEERLSGYELSIFAITDGKISHYMQPAQDYKRVGEGDKGPNTGGMGAISPVKGVSKELLKKIDIKIIRPVLMALEKEGYPFKGCLYAGLMIDNGEPKVIEFNCRFGDPETQVILPLLETDLYDILESSASGDMSNIKISFKDKSCCCVTVCSRGYPGKYKKGFEISGLDNINEEDVFLFHAGTVKKDEKVISNGGRVFNISALGNTTQDARNKVYRALERVKFENMFFRKDIGYKK